MTPWSNRRLDVGLFRDRFFRKIRAKKARTELMAWPESLKGIWPHAISTHTEYDQTYANYKLGCFSGIVDGDTDNGWPDCRRDALIALVEAFERVQAERPEKPQTSVAALINWPHMFGSEICIFFTPEKEQGFTPEGYRQAANSSDVTTEYGFIQSNMPGPNPFDALNVTIPAQTSLGGYHLHEIDLDDMHETSNTYWSLMADGQRLSKAEIVT